MVSLYFLVPPFPVYEILLNVQCVLFLPMKLYTLVDLTNLLIPCLCAGSEIF